MTLDELIQELESAREDLGGDAEVRIAYQENYPLRGTVARVTVPEMDDPYSDGESATGQEKDGSMVWIAVCSAPYDENPYGPAWAWTGEFPEDELDCGHAPDERGRCPAGCAS